MADAKRVIIRRVKKVVHGGHHGGSWKVAYADFVTAMMAFFLLLWLMNAANDAEKAGLSDYFQAPSVAVPGQVTANAGQGAGDGPGPGAGPGTSQGTRLVETGTADAADAQATAELAAERADKAKLEALKQELTAAIESNEALAPYKDQLLLDATADGLRIQIVDKENRVMFDGGSAELKPYTSKILRELGKTINAAPNRISLTGHTDAARFRGQQGYSNWELSADRANASRRELIAGGLTEAKIARVEGLSSTVPFNKADPGDPVNRRIAIVILNRSAEQALLGAHEEVQTADEASALIETPPPDARPAATGVGPAAAAPPAADGSGTPATTQSAAGGSGSPSTPESATGAVRAPTSP